MRWANPANLIALLGVIATLLTAWVAINASYDLSERGDAPPKRLEATSYGAANPLDDLTKPGSTFSIKVTDSGRGISNLRVLQTRLENTGRAPITPGDMVEPLSLETRDSWEIVNVVNDNPRLGQQLKWSRKSKTKFEAAPALLNPGDTVWATVYLTGSGSGRAEDKPSVSWRARIVNLRQIEDKSDDILTKYQKAVGPLIIILWGWGVFITVGTFAVYLLLTTLLMHQSKIIHSSRPLSYGWLAAASILNLSAAEAGNSYIFGTSPYEYYPVDHLFNAPPIVLNAFLIIFLSLRSWRGRQAA